METLDYILVGGGEHARVVLDCLLAQGARVKALFDPMQSGFLFGVPQLGKYRSDYEPQAKAIVAIGDNRTRKKVAESTRHPFGLAIHPSTVCSSYAKIGEGSMILHGAIVQAQSTIGRHVILNTGSKVDHDAMIGDYVHIGPGAILCGTITVGEGAFIGAGATIIPGRKIGAWSMVGAGSVVIRDVPEYTIVAGNPARVIKHVVHA